MNIGVATRERIVLADALRGFALMGLFIVHMVEYFELYWYKPEPGWIHNAIFFLFGGKAYGIFALLFGFSFYIILDNYQRRGIDFRLRFIWRCVVLLGIGYLHSLLYAGDILQLLATGGVLLVLCFSFNQRTLIIIGLFLLLQIPTLLFLLYQILLPTANYDQPHFIAFMAANFNVFANGNLQDLVQHNLIDGQKGKWTFFIETGRLWNIYGLMIAGLLLGRIGFFEGTVNRSQLFAAIACAATVFCGIWLLQGSILSIIPTGMPHWFADQILGYLKNLAVITVEISLFCWLYLYTKSVVVLKPFAACGKITLTLYLLQSVIFVPVYYGFGLGWYATTTQSQSLALGLGCWLLQMLGAMYYLKITNMGPMEKVWRRLTLIGLKLPVK